MPNATGPTQPGKPNRPGRPAGARSVPSSRVPSVAAGPVDARPVDAGPVDARSVDAGPVVSVSTRVSSETGTVALLSGQADGGEVGDQPASAHPAEVELEAVAAGDRSAHAGAGH